MSVNRSPLRALIAIFAATVFSNHASTAAETSTDAAVRRPVVLVYFANDPYETQRFAKNRGQIVQWLRESGASELLAAADKIETDRIRLSDAIRRDILEIRQLVDAGRISAAAFFTNELAHRNEFMTTGPLVSEDVRHSVAFEVGEDFVYESQPLCHPDSLGKALAATADVFDPQRFDFILVTKSHGTVKSSLVPSLGLDVSAMTKAEFLLEARDSLDCETCPRSDERVQLDPPGGANPLDPPGGTNPLDPPGGTNPLDPPGGTNPLSGGKYFVEGYGIDKQVYASTIAQAGAERGMTFVLLFCESCHSGLTDAQIGVMRNCVEALETSGEKGLDYRTVHYSELLSNDEGDNFASSLQAAIKKAIALR